LRATPDRPGSISELIRNQQHTGKCIKGRSGE
jgi:hypothetical protein